MFLVDVSGEKMPIETRRVEGIEGLTREALQIASTLQPGRFLWYRGLNCSSHKLIPKIMRDGKAPDEVFERERRMLTRFRQRSMAYWPAGYPQNDWEHLFAMQHYGMPTRLLDWSENLFVSAHFALMQHEVNGHGAECLPVVWCVDPVEWNRSTHVLTEFGDVIHVLTTADEELDPYRPETTKRRSKSPIAMYGAHNSARIVAQRGTFMVWGNEASPLEEIESTAHLYRLEIVGEREALAGSLRALGFSETMVFPELPSLSMELSRMEGWRA